MQFERAYSFVIHKLKEELPDYLSYHNVEHTKEVVQAVQDLGAREHISQAEQDLLNAAALFHDTGFLHGYENHEESSCALARQYLPDFDYDHKHIDAICRLILATKTPQQPTDHLSRILCDADLCYLGGNRYSQRAEALYQEMEGAGIKHNWDDWQHIQMRFLKGHHYFTGTAKKTWEPTKLKNLQQFTKKFMKTQEHGHAHPKNNADSVRDLALMAVGVFTAAFALKGFLVPNKFFDGGVTGLSLLIHELFDFNLSVTTFVLNLPFIIAGFFVVSRRFAYKTLASVVLMGLCLLFIPYPTVTSDKLLISVFGGIFLGLGGGMVMRAGCAIDGIEVLALYTWKRTSFTIYEIILAINVVIFIIAALHFGFDTALYSILTYLAATRTIDFVVEGIEAYTGVTIISGNSEVIKSRLVNELGRSITIYKGERGFLPGSYDKSAPVDIIFTVITRLELRRLQNVVRDSDPNAFVFANTIREASGGIIKRRHVH